MNAASLVVVIVGIALAAGVVAWFVFRRNEPEATASHGSGERTGSDRYFTSDAGSPGLEAMGVAGPGEPTPGPSADAPGGPETTGEERRTP